MLRRPRRSSNVYPDTTVKVAIINLPRMLKLPLASVLSVLPARVQARVVLLGDDYERVLAEDLDADALRLMTADRSTLARHRGRRIE
jgi:hypothetical protein